MRLHVSCELGQLDDVNAALAQGADPNAPDKSGRTPLILAAKYGHSDVCALLLSCGACSLTSDRRNLTAIHHACSGNHPTALHVLVQHTIRPSDSSQDSPFNYPNPNPKKPVRDRAITPPSPLHVAVSAKAAPCVEALLAEGYCATCQDEQQQTPLHLSAAKGDCAAIDLLLAACPSAVDFQDVRGQTALHLAAASGHADATNRLLLAASNPRTRNNRGHPPLHLALSHQHSQVVYILVSHALVPKAIASSRSAATRNAGAWATRSMAHDVVDERHAAVTRLLLESRFDGEVVCREVAAHRAEVVQLLLDGGADFRARRRNQSLVMLCLQDTADLRGTGGSGRQRDERKRATDWGDVGVHLGRRVGLSLSKSAHAGEAAGCCAARGKHRGEMPQVMSAQGAGAAFGCGRKAVQRFLEELQALLGGVELEEVLDERELTMAALLQAGAPAQRSPFGSPCFAHAAALNDWPICAMLLLVTFPEDFTQEEVEEALEHAVRFLNPPLVATLLAARPLSCTPPASSADSLIVAFEHYPTANGLLLHFALTSISSVSTLRSGLLPVLQLLLEAGYSASATDQEGNSVLHTAMRHIMLLWADIVGTPELEAACMQVLELLVAAGAPVDVLDASGRSVLHCCAPRRVQYSCGLLRMVQFLVEQGTPYWVKDCGRVGFMLSRFVSFEGGSSRSAALRGACPRVSWLGQPLSFLQLVVAQGSVHLLRAMVRHLGVGLQDPDCEGQTLLHIACQYLAEPSIRFLLRDGQADVLARDRCHCTPLHVMGQQIYMRGKAAGLLSCYARKDCDLTRERLGRRIKNILFMKIHRGLVRREVFLPAVDALDMDGNRPVFAQYLWHVREVYRLVGITALLIPEELVWRSETETRALGQLVCRRSDPGITKISDLPVEVRAKIVRFVKEWTLTGVK